MSGGYFDYDQYRIKEIERSIKRLIRENDSDAHDEYGSPVGRGYSAKTIAKFKEAAELLSKAEILVQRIDWLVSGDDGEESFHVRLEEDLTSLYPIEEDSCWECGATNVNLFRDHGDPLCEECCENIERG